MEKIAYRRDCLPVLYSCSHILLIKQSGGQIEGHQESKKSLATMGGIKEKIIGEGEGYEYKTLCMPTTPWSKTKMPVKFYPLDEALPFILSLLMGLQHAFAMVGGIITPPYVVMKFTVE